MKSRLSLCFLVLVLAGCTPKEKERDEQNVSQPQSMQEVEKLKVQVRQLQSNRSKPKQCETCLTQINALRAEVAQLQCPEYEFVKYPPICCLPFFSRYQAWADALYWDPLFDGVEYATIIGNPSEVVEVMPHYTWGYKVGAQIYHNCDMFYLGAEYFHYRQTGTSEVSAPGAISPFFQVPLAPLADSATGKIMSKYQAVDITAGYQWLGCLGWQSYLFAGARYVNITEKEFFAYNDGGVVTPASQRYCIKGWGPRVGGNFTLFPFPCLCYLNNLGISGQVAVAGIIANTRLSVSSAANVFAPEGTLNFPPGEEFILGIDLKLQGIYVICVGSLKFDVRGGYELHSYQNARQRLTSSNQLGNEPKNVSALGYGGPFVGLSISY